MTADDESMSAQKRDTAAGKAQRHHIQVHVARRCIESLIALQQELEWQVRVTPLDERMLDVWWQEEFMPADSWASVITALRWFDESYAPFLAYVRAHATETPPSVRGWESTMSPQARQEYESRRARLERVTDAERQHLESDLSYDQQDNP